MNQIGNEFVDLVFERKRSDSSFRAIMKSAAVPSLEWKAWTVINRFVKNLDDTIEREAYALVGSSIAKSHFVSNGVNGIGKAIRIASKETDDKNVFPPRLLRLLSANSSEELIDIMRPLLSFLDSKGIALDYKKILEDILQFRYGEDARMKVKSRWASDYFSKGEDNVSK